MIKAKDPAPQGQVLFISSGFSALYGDCTAVDKMLITLFFDLPISEDTCRLFNRKDEYGIPYDSTLNLKYLPCVCLYLVLLLASFNFT